MLIVHYFDYVISTYLCWLFASMDQVIKVHATNHFYEFFSALLYV